MIMTVFRFGLLKKEQIFNRKCYMSSPTGIEIKHNRLQHPSLISSVLTALFPTSFITNPQAFPHATPSETHSWVEGVEVKDTSASVRKRCPLLKQKAPAHK